HQPDAVQIGLGFIKFFSVNGFTGQRHIGFTPLVSQRDDAEIVRSLSTERIDTLQRIIARGLASRWAAISALILLSNLSRSWPAAEAGNARATAAAARKVLSIDEFIGAQLYLLSFYRALSG